MIDLLNNEEVPESIRTFTNIVHKLTYLNFIKTPNGIEFPISDKGITKDPASYHNFFIIPLSSEIALLLVDASIKVALQYNSNKELIKRYNGMVFFSQLPQTYINDDKSEYNKGLLRMPIPLKYVSINRNHYYSKLSYVASLVDAIDSISDPEDEFIKSLNDFYLKNVSSINVEKELERYPYLLTLDKEIINTLKHVKILFNLYNVDRPLFNIEFNKTKYYCKERLINLFFTSNDIFIYDVHTIDFYTAIFLCSTIQEESINQFAFKSYKGQIHSLFRDEISYRELPIPKYNQLIKECISNEKNFYYEVKKFIINFKDSKL